MHNSFRPLLGAILIISSVTLGWLFWPSLKAESQETAVVASATSQDPLHPVETFAARAGADNLPAAFVQAGLPYYPEDRISSFPDLSLGLGGVITVERALPVEMVDGKKKYQVRTWQTTVEGLLREKKIDLGADDRIAPALATSLTQGSTVAITRVARTEVKDYETVAYQTIERTDEAMYRGEKKITQEGRNGKREKKYLVIREDGELKSKILVANTIVEAAVDKIIKIGTRLKVGKVVSGKATWYECCGTKVATDAFKKGTEIRVTNLDNGKQIFVTVDGCICGGRSELVVDLHPSYFQRLGGQLGQGVFSSVRVEEILN